MADQSRASAPMSMSSSMWREREWPASVDRLIESGGREEDVKGMMGEGMGAYDSQRADSQNKHQMPRPHAM